MIIFLSIFGYLLSGVIIGVLSYRTKVFQEFYDSTCSAVFVGLFWPIGWLWPAAIYLNSGLDKIETKKREAVKELERRNKELERILRAEGL